MTRRTRLFISVAAMVVIGIVAVVLLTALQPPPEGAYDLSEREAERVSGIIGIVGWVPKEGGGLYAAALEQAFPDTDFYFAGGPYGSIIAIRDDEVYTMPDHFNCLLVDSGQSATGEDQEAVLQSLVILISPVEVVRLPMRFEGYGVIYEEREGYWYPFEAQIESWSEAGGVRIHWEFSVEVDRVQVSDTTGQVVAVGEGAYSPLPPGVSYEVAGEMRVITWNVQSLGGFPGGGCP